MKGIIEGTLNNVLGNKEELFQERFAICKKCKLYKEHPTFGPVCNSSLYLNTETDKVSKVKLDGYLKGCGCILKSKCRATKAKCPTKKW